MNDNHKHKNSSNCNCYSNCSTNDVLCVLTMCKNDSLVAHFVDKHDCYSGLSIRISIPAVDFGADFVVDRVW